MKMLEKICRAICHDKEIDPDRLACPFIPEFINATPLINGFFVPPPAASCKTWELFKEYVEIAFKAGNVEDVLEDEVLN